VTRRAVAIGIAAAGIVAVAGGCGRSHSDEGEAEADATPVAVGCAPARPAPATERVSLRGVVAVPPDRDAVVAPAVPGRLVEVRVHEGDRVSRGDLLARVADPALAAAVGEGEAAVSAAGASLVNAEAALARARRLVDRGIAPRRDVEDGEARRAAAAAELATARARDRLAVRQRDRARVVAPLGGVVVHVLRRAGDLVDGTAATPVVEIADPVELELRADAPAADLVRLREGAPVIIRLDAVPGQDLRGAIVFAGPSVDPATSLGQVRASIAPPSFGALQLKFGLAGQIEAEVAGRTGAVLVPAGAVRRATTGAEEVVLCAAAAAAAASGAVAAVGTAVTTGSTSGDDDADDTASHGTRGAVAVARVRAVQVGARVGDDIEIAAGLAPGQLVVTSHVLGLEDGAAIQIAGPPAPRPRVAP